jgi:hypothetical protein
MEAVGRSRAFSGTRFNCKLRIARKSNSATSPEGWEWVGSARRGFVERLTAVQAIQNGALLERNVTHSAFVDWHEDWQANRLIERQEDGAQFVVEAVIGIGKQGRGGRQSFMSLSLSEKNPRTEI